MRKFVLFALGASKELGNDLMLPLHGDGTRGEEWGGGLIERGLHCRILYSNEGLKETGMGTY